MAEHCPAVAPIAAAVSGPPVAVASQEHVTPGRADMLQETVCDLDTNCAADVNSTTDQHITNAATAGEVPQTPSGSDGDPDRGGLEIAAENGEDWSSSSVVPSHVAFESTVSRESTLPVMLCMLCKQIWCLLSQSTVGLHYIGCVHTSSAYCYIWHHSLT